MNKKFVSGIFVTAALVPAFAFADSTQQLAGITSQLQSLLLSLSSYINQLPSNSTQQGGGNDGKPNYFQYDQGGSIELGADSSRAPTWNGDVGIPYVDFHQKFNKVEDWNARIINDADGQLSVVSSNLFDVKGGAIIHVAGNTNPHVGVQGAYLGWNALTAGTGETDFINNYGLGAGGFAFYNIAPGTQSVQGTKPIVQISGKGNVEVGNSSAPMGITLHDDSGGAAYCVKIHSGQLTATAGACN
jgi:hypothetical protein